MREQEITNEACPAKEETPPQNPGKAPKKKKRRGFRRFLTLLIIIFFIWAFSNYTLKITKYKVYSDKITEKIRIAVISDLHASRHGITNENILNKINDTGSDIVFMLGDMYSRNSGKEEMEIPVKLVSMIAEEGLPVYFVPGEHDTSQEYLAEMEAAGAHVMDYKSEIINVKGNNIEILGIDNVYFSPTFDLNNAFTLTPGCFSILMAHIPNYESYADFGADLTICGDTHGGIIQLPFDRGPAYYSETGEWFPEISGLRDDIYDKGMFEYSGGAMLITSGIGAYPVPARLNNRPEIAVVDILPLS